MSERHGEDWQSVCWHPFLSFKIFSILTAQEMEMKKRAPDIILNKTKQIKKTAFKRKVCVCVCVCVCVSRAMYLFGVS